MEKESAGERKEQSDAYLKKQAEAEGRIFDTDEVKQCMTGNPDEDVPDLEELTEEDIKKRKEEKEKEWLQDIINKHSQKDAEEYNKPDHLKNAGSGLAAGG